MKDLEEQEQIATVEWFEAQFPKLAESLHHSPNGGKRHISVAKKLKKMGARRGFPDLVLYHWCELENTPGIAIEMKLPGEKLRKDQAKWLKRLALCRFETCVCYSAKDAFAALENYVRRAGV